MTDVAAANNPPPPGAPGQAPNTTLTQPAESKTIM
jgi:hypothetical protein